MKLVVFPAAVGGPLSVNPAHVAAIRSRGPQDQHTEILISGVWVMVNELIHNVRVSLGVTESGA